MANPEHLEILEQGVEVWNKWREDNQDIKPNLRWIIFNGANLDNANLSEANLSNANLIKNSHYGKCETVSTYCPGITRIIL